MKRKLLDIIDEHKKKAPISYTPGSLNPVTYDLSNQLAKFSTILAGQARNSKGKLVRTWAARSELFAKEVLSFTNSLERYLGDYSISASQATEMLDYVRGLATEVRSHNYLERVYSPEGTLARSSLDSNLDSILMSYEIVKRAATDVFAGELSFSDLMRKKEHTSNYQEQPFPMTWTSHGRYDKVLERSREVLSPLLETKQSPLDLTGQERETIQAGTYALFGVSGNEVTNYIAALDSRDSPRVTRPEDTLVVNPIAPASLSMPDHVLSNTGAGYSRKGEEYSVSQDAPASRPRSFRRVMELMKTAKSYLVSLLF